MDAQTKMQALQLIAAIIRGLGDRDRNTASIQADALKAAVRAAKEAADSETCLAAAGVASAKISVWACFGIAGNVAATLGSAGNSSPVCTRCPQQCFFDGKVSSPAKGRYSIGLQCPAVWLKLCLEASDGFPTVLLQAC